MIIQTQNQNLSWKSLTPLFLIVCYWFSISVCFGYFLAKLFYNFFDTMNKDSLYKIIKFRKKFHLENRKKFALSSILKFFKNWIKRISKKCLLVFESIKEVINVLKICRKEFQSILKFKHNFQVLKFLFTILWEALRIVRSLVTDMFLIHNIIKFVIIWQQLLLILMSESVLITRFIYFLYMILLGLFGVVLGFLLGVYSQNDDLYVFMLLFLLEILYDNKLGYVLLEPEKVGQLSTFSLKTIEQINPRPLKIILEGVDQRPQIPLPILSDPFVWIDSDFIWEESKNYKFELFQFYRTLNEKVKY